MLQERFSVTFASLLVLVGTACASVGPTPAPRAPIRTADGLTFVEKRMGHHKNNLVSTTERAIMSEVSLFYQQGEVPDDDEEEGTDSPRP